MKLKKILGSIFASVFAVTSVAAVTSCDNDEEPVGGDTQNVDEEIVQAALDALTVAAEATEDFTLTTKGNGNVSISWASNNTDVITIDGGSAKVTRPIFNQEDASVKLTATAVLNDVTKTKEFTVTVAHLVDSSKTIAEVKALDLNSTATIKGNVTGFVYASGSTDPEYACGYYVTDATGTIYVYDPSGAAKLAVNNDVYLTGKLTTKNSGIQISSVTEQIVYNQEGTPDWTTVVTDKTISDIVSLDLDGKKAACGVVYEFITKVDKSSSYKTYYLQDPQDNSDSLLVFFSGSATNDKDDYKFDELVKDNVGSIVKVRFVVNSLNSSDKPRGTVLEILPLSVAEQKTYISSSVKEAVVLDTHITEATEKNLPAAMAGYDKCSIAWSLKDGSAGAVIADNKLTITPTDSLQTFTLVATITIEGETDPIVVEYDEVMVKTSFEPVSYEEFVAAQSGDMLFVQGTIVAIGGHNSTYNNANVVLQDATTGGYYVYRFPCTEDDIKTGGKYAIGTVVKVYGQKDVYNTVAQIEQPLAKNIQVISEAGTLPEAIDISSIEQSADLANYGNTRVTINKMLYTGSNFVTKGMALLEIDDQFYDEYTLEAGKVYSFTGIVSNVAGKYMIAPTDANAFAEVTENIDSEFVFLYVYGIFGQGEIFNTTTTVHVPQTLFGYDIAYSVGSGSTTVAYNSTTSSVTITVDKVETTILTLTTTANSVSTPYQLPITTDNTKFKATLAYPGGSTTNMTEGTNYAEILGANSDHLTITSVKNDASNHVGLNTSGNMRLYANKTSGNGTELVITANNGTGLIISITSIEIEFGSTVGSFTVNGATGSEDITTYNISSTEVRIKNVTTGSTTQVHINSIVVNYTVEVDNSVTDYTLTLNTNGATLNDGVETSISVAMDALDKNVSLPTAADFASTPYDLEFLGWTDGTNMYTSTYEVTDFATLTAVFDNNISIEKAIEIASQSPSGQFTVTGTISSIDTEYNSEYENITITITDGTNSLVCFRLSGGSDLAVGDSITVTGSLSTYEDAAQFAAGATYSKN